MSVSPVNSPADVLLLRRVVPGPSLLSQLASGWAGRWRRFAGPAPRIRPSLSGWSIRLATALILTVPLTTKAGSELLGWLAREEGRVFAEQAGARASANRRLEAVIAARAELAQAIGRPSIGETMMLLAAALPASATVDRVSRDATGALTVVVAVTDPDVLREALGRSPALAPFREVAQEGSDAGGLTVTLRSFDL